MPSSRLCALAYLCVWSGDAPLYFYAVRDDLDQTRKMGLARGLVDFARMLSTPQQPVHAVHSSSQRFLFLEPEPDLFLHAVIDLPRFASHKRSTSASSVVDKGASSDEGIQDEIFLAELRQAYEEFKLLNGSFDYLKSQQTTEQLQRTVRGFFESWVRSWRLERSNLSEVSIPHHLGLVQGEPIKEAEDALTTLDHEHLLCACAFHERRLQASTSKVTLETFGAFTRYIVTQLPAPDPPSTSAALDHTSPGSKRVPSESWKSTFGMNNLSSFLAMPSFAGSTPPKSDLGKSTSTPPHQGSSAGPGSGSKTWTRVISLGLYGSGDEKGPPTPDDQTAPGSKVEVEAQVDADEMAEAMDSDSDESVADHIARLVARDKAEEGEGSTGSDSVVDREEPELEAGEVLPETQEHNGSEPKVMLEAVAGADGEAEKAPPLENADPSPVGVSGRMSIFCPTEDDSSRWAKALWISSKQASIALVMSSDIAEADEASLIQKATHALTSVQPTPLPALSAHRYLVSNPSSNTFSASSWPDRAAQWSGSEAAAKEADTAGCILEALRTSEPAMNEMFIRQQSGQWTVSKRLASQQVTLVLSKRFAKEDSLVDADAVLREALANLSDQS